MSLLVNGSFAENEVALQASFICDVIRYNSDIFSRMEKPEIEALTKAGVSIESGTLSQQLRTKRQISNALFLKEEEVEENVREDVCFENCYFFYLVTISNASFKKKVQFYNCIFYEGLIILHSDFEQILSFHKCKVGQEFTMRDNNIDSFYAFAPQFEFLNLYGNAMRNGFLISPLGENSITSLVIEMRPYNEMNLKLRELKIGSITISGTNNKGELHLEYLKIGSLVFNYFYNYGKVKIVELFLKDEKTELAFNKSNMGQTLFMNVPFKQFNEIHFENTNLIEISIIGSNWGTKNIVSYNNKSFVELHENFRDLFRQLKIVMSRQGDSIFERKFHAEEMNAYYKTIQRPFFSRLGEKFVIVLSRLFSDYGQSFLRPLIFLFLFNAIFYYIQCYYFKTYIIASEHCIPEIGQFFHMLNPARRLDESVRGWSVFWDMLSRISSSFFIYNIIRATRRFIK